MMIRRLYDFFIGRPIYTKELVVLPFVLLSLLIFCNLNGILNSVFGISNLGSPLILICCLIILYIIPTSFSDFNVSLRLFIGFLLLFLILGWVSGLMANYNPQFELNTAIKSTREIITGIIILTTYYVYAQWSAQNISRDFIILLIFGFFLFTLLVGVFEDLLGLREILYLNYDNSRHLGFFGNPNETGMQANLTLILSLYLYLRQKIGKIITIVLILLCSYGALSSVSKLAIILNVVLLIIFVGYLLLRSLKAKQSNRTDGLKFILLLGIVLAVIIRLIAIPYWAQLNTMQQKRITAISQLVFKGEFTNKTTSLRAGLFEDAIEKIKEKPVLGYGLSTFSKGGMLQSSPSHGVHNMYLKIAGEAGLIAAFLFIFVLLFFLYNALFKIVQPLGFIYLCFIISYIMYAFASHNVFGQKFIIGLMGIILTFNKASLDRG